jgi:hypothetical protein
MRSVAAITLPLIAACGSLAVAAELPMVFTGTWVRASSTDVACSNSDWKGPATDERLISITGREILDFESGCRILDVKVNRLPLDQSMINATVELACSGEGMSSRIQDVWHVQTMQGRKVLTATSIRQWDYRDDAGRRMKPPVPFEMETSVYLECK